MNETELRAFLARPLMMLVAVQGADGAAAVGRGMGARLADDGTLVVRMSARQWPDVAGGLGVGCEFALTLCEASSYHSYQYKGRVVSVEPAGAAEEDAARRYAQASGAELERLGVAAPSVAQWFCLEDLLCVAFAPRQAFTQTPGPEAGRSVAA